MLFLFSLDYGLAIVNPAFEAYMMRKNRLVTLRTGSNLWQLYAVVSSPHIPFGLG